MNVYRVRVKVMWPDGDVFRYTVWIEHPDIVGAKDNAEYRVERHVNSGTGQVAKVEVIEGKRVSWQDVPVSFGPGDVKVILDA